MTRDFTHSWRAEILAAPPLIAPARQFTYPHRVEGEEDAMARGALLLLVHPGAAPGQPQSGPFLATCALGFQSPSMPSGVWSCPDPGELCAVAGGYGYLIDTDDPTRSIHLPLRPIVQVLSLPEHNLLVFIGFHALAARGPGGLAWHTERLSSEGLETIGIDTAENGNPQMHGLGWDMRTDRDVPFTVDLRTGRATGGPFRG